VAMLRRAAHQWTTWGHPRFVHATRLGVARIQHPAGHGEADEVREAVTAPLVLLDDLGAERDTANNAVGDVITERHAEGRSTWVTTGLSQGEIVKRYGGGIARRLFEGAAVIDCAAAAALRKAVTT
jgi:DNA replication protein DnaC